MLVHNTCTTKNTASKPIQKSTSTTNSAKKSKLQEVFDLADNYTLTDRQYTEHIVKRHGPNSAYSNKSHFNESFDIRAGIDSTLRGSNSIVKPNTGGRAGYIFEQTFSDAIGADSKGRALNTLKVVIDENGSVITAFPKR